MGIISSDNRDYKTSLYSKIKEIVKDLLYKYEFWTNPEICDKLTLVYYDKLIQYKKSDLVDASTYIGIKHGPTPKDLCVNIITHYRKRIELLRTIWNEIDKNRNKVIQAKKGPVCRNVDMYVDNFFTCEKYGGLWQNSKQYNEIINKLKKAKVYDKWVSHVENLEKKWKEYMRRLLKNINDIKEDIDNTIDEDGFESLNDECMLTIKKLNYITDIYYLLAINYG